MSRWLVCAAAVCLAVSAAPAQMPDTPALPAPRPAADPTTSDTMPAPAMVPEQPAPYVLPPVDSWNVPPLPSPDPLLDRPGAPLPGLFFNVEPNVLGVHFRNQLQIAVPVSPTRTDLVRFYGPRLDDTVSPRFELGCRLEDGWGELFVGYRFLNTDGSNPVPNSTVAAHESGRLALNSFDFGYSAQEFALGPNWDMRWRTGLRFSAVYYDARFSFDQPSPVAGALLGQHEVNYFWGLGPLVGLELSRKTMIPGLSVFGRLNGALQFGHITQTGIEDLAGTGGGGPEQFQAKYGFEVTVLTLAEEVGLSYTVPDWNHSRFLIGYHYETWWQVGRFNFTQSRGQIDAQGVFLRAELNF
jgi:hypothetical protein